MLILSACSSNLSEETIYGSIAGSVSDKTTGEPVSTVNVTLTPGGSSTVTGSDGSFSFTNLEPGEYAIIVNKENYSSYSQQINVRPGESTALHILIDRLPSSLIADLDLLDFGENLLTLSFKIVNTGYTDIVYNVETGDCKWLSVDPTEGSLKYGKTATLVVTINRAILPEGENEANIVVRSTSGDGNYEIKVLAVNNSNASVNTLDVSDAGSNVATLNGEIINPGSPSYTERGFIYNTQASLSIDNCIMKLSTPVNKEKNFSCKIDGLTPNKTYYAKTYLVQNGKIIYGNTVSFTTTQEQTSISTSAVTQISASTATFNGSILKTGMPSYTERGFVYSKEDSPTISDKRIKVSGTGTGNYSAQITDLEYPTTYYVRAYAIQGGNAVYGNTVSFTTMMSTTAVTTSAVTQISSTYATFNGSVTDVGMPPYSERGFCYSTSLNPTINTNKLPVSGSGAGNYSAQVSNLIYPQTYYVCAYALQDGRPIYGNVVSFTTEFRYASVNTSAATNITDNSAQLNASITDVGSPSYTQRGFCYSSSSTYPTVYNDKVSMYSSLPGNYKETITNLREGTTYYVRAFVEQDNEYVYGNTISFTTNSLPSVNTNNISGLKKVDPFGGGFYYQWSATFNGYVQDVGNPPYSSRGFVYGNTINPEASTGTVVNVNGNGKGSFSATINNLSDMKIYHVRAFVKVGKKYYYGHDVEFSTF